jgi:predicted flavoprotein YhiN
VRANTKVIIQNTKKYSSREVEKFSTRSNNNPSNQKHYDIGVIGAGPAGIMAAIYAARTGKSVAVLEKNEAIGRKILATGNGRCNISNKNISIDHYHGTNPAFAIPILKEFNATEFFESLGVILKEEDRGRLFPRTGQASSVVDALEAELIRLKVEIRTGFTVKRFASPSLSSLSEENLPAGKAGDPEILHSVQSDSAWAISSESGDAITATKLILTTGGRAAHQFGSSGDGLFWAKNMGHTIFPIHAALVALEAEEAWVKEIMGIRLATTATLFANNKIVDSRNGDILFTHYGISGPAAMGLAREVDPLLLADKKVEISVDLAPDLTAEALDAQIAKLAEADGKKQIKTILAGLIPKNLVSQVLTLSRISLATKAAELSKTNRQAIIPTIKDFRLTISKVRPLKEAQVTAGGIDTDEVNASMESKIVPNLYFAGEILDIDGASGGFNLHWAWASGMVAGESAAGTQK